MSTSVSSALITDQGRRVLLRVRGQHCELTQESLRKVLGLPAGPPGLGISIDGERWCFEFTGDNQFVEMSEAQLHRRLGKVVTKSSKCVLPAS